LAGIWDGNRFSKEYFSAQQVVRGFQIDSVASEALGQRHLRLCWDCFVANMEQLGVHLHYSQLMALVM
jgi:hypothetical protein